VASARSLISQTQPNSSSLLTTARDISISAISNVDGAAAEPYRPAIGQDPETAERHLAGAVGEANYGR
jgi:hypothetical protein